MIGMILVTHGRLAEELRLAMEHVVGAQRGVDTVCIGPDDDVDTRRAEIEACIGRWHEEQGQRQGEGRRNHTQEPRQTQGLTCICCAEGIAVSYGRHHRTGE